MKARRRIKVSPLRPGKKSPASALRQSEDGLNSLFRAAPFGVGVVVDRVFKDVNERFCELTGYRRDELINKSARMVYPTDEDFHFVGQVKYRQIAERGIGVVETRFRRKDGRIIDVLLSSAPIDPSDLEKGVTFTVQDITERKRAEEVLTLKMEQLTSLIQATQTVTASLDIDNVLAEIVSLAGKVVPSHSASVVLVDEKGQVKQRSAETLPGAPRLHYRARAEGFTSWIARTLRPAVVDDIGEDGVIRSEREEGAPTTANPVLPACGIRSFVGLPLISKGRLLGVLYLHSLRPRAFRDHLPILAAFANQAAVAVENADLYDATRKELTERADAEMRLQKTVSLLQATLDSTADGILVVDLEGKIQSYNERFRKMWRIPPAVLETKKDDRALEFVLDQLKNPEKFLDKVRQLYGDVYAESYDTLEFNDGRIFERFSRPQFLGEEPVGRVWSFRDVTERTRAAETMVLQSAALSAAANGIVITDRDGAIEWVNPAFTALTGYTWEESRGRNPRELVRSGRQEASFYRQMWDTILAGQVWRGELINRRKDGSLYFEEMTITPVRGEKGDIAHFVAVKQDVTERKKDEEMLKAALEEREVMLREIHHRVKNNIQVVSSLLRLQSRHIKDEKALEALSESQNRIKSMALIHEKLYQSQDFARIEFSDYIAKMLVHLFAIYKVESSRVRYRVEAENIQLDVNRAIPCGLIINELVTNSLKHAFPQDRKGEILVLMRSVGGDKYELTVKDDGVGLPDGLDFGRPGTLGFQIVSDLAKQLDGSVDVRRDEGTEITVHF